LQVLASANGESAKAAQAINTKNLSDIAMLSVLGRRNRSQCNVPMKAAL
jgi:hypothetical protein